VLATAERLKKHEQVHKKQELSDASYVDPSNVGHPLFAHPSFFVANATEWLLGKRKKKRA